MNQEEKLMRLSIPANWAVTYNQFHDVDPVLNEESNSGTYKNWYHFTEDLMQITKLSYEGDQKVVAQNHLLIDLGYYPEGKAEGEYTLSLVWPKDDSMDWENAEKFISKDRFEIRDKIEEWLERY